VTGQAVPAGDPRARIVWRDGDVELATCPVRAIDAESEQVLGWFAATHEMTGGFGVAWWRLERLPESGGVDEQDARLMASLEYVRQLQNTLLAEDRKPSGDPRKDRGRQG